jgi:hypothetical protein
MSDTTLPNVTINSPAPNATVSGTRNISVTVSDNVGVQSTELWIDPYSPPGVTVSKAFPNPRTDYYLRPNVGLLLSKGFTESATFAGSRTVSPSNPFPRSTDRWVLNLENYIDRALDTAILNKIRGTFDNAIANGVKIVFHITYQVSFKPLGWAEPTLGRIEGHLAQLQPILEQYKHVFSSFCFGIAGAWGECFSAFESGPGFTGLCNQANQLAIRDLLLEYLPAGIHILHRYLRATYDQSGDDWTGWFTTPIQSSEAYGQVGGWRWRIGQHIDSAMVGGYQDGLYDYQAGTKWPEVVPLDNPRIVAQQTYLRETGKWSPMYVEGGNLNQFANGGADVASGFTRLQAVQWLREHGVTNFNFYADSFSKPRDWLGVNHPDADLFRRTVGYLLWLKDFELTVSADNVTVTMDWENPGSSGLHWKTPLWLELGNTLIKLSDNLHLETPRQGQTMNNVTYSLARPASLTPGVKAVRLWMPDQSTALRNDARYAIPLHSQGASFDTDTGRNDLGLSIAVT